jgi:hypothetical protein
MAVGIGPDVALGREALSVSMEEGVGTADRCPVRTNALR